MLLNFLTTNRLYLPLFQMLVDSIYALPIMEGAANEVSI